MNPFKKFIYWLDWFGHKYGLAAFAPGLMIGVLSFAVPIAISLRNKLLDPWLVGIAILGFIILIFSCIIFYFAVSDLRLTSKNPKIAIGRARELIKEHPEYDSPWLNVLIEETKKSEEEAKKLNERVDILKGLARAKKDLRGLNDLEKEIPAQKKKVEEKVKVLEDKLLDNTASLIV